MITIVEESNREQLWNFIKNRSADLFYYIYNYQNNFEKSKFWITSEEDQPNGVILYDGQTLRISGPSTVVKEFLEFIDFTPIYLSIPRSSADIALNYIKSSKRKLDMIRLTLKHRSFENLSVEDFTYLKKEDLNEALTVFQNADHEDWDSVEVSNLLYDKMNRWYGLRINNTLASVCWNQFYPCGGHVAFIATHPNYQNQGHATHLLKLVLTENFKENSLAIIHVSEQNDSAYHCYRKIGFQEHCKYTVLCEPIMQG